MNTRSASSEIYPHHHEITVLVAAPGNEVFAFIDDHSKLSAHMTRRSWMMGGGAMRIETDAMGGKAVDSTIRLSGSILGIRLSVEEVVVERVPPQRKVWRTCGEPRLLVIGAYQLGVDVERRGQSSLLRVFIDYAYPTTGIWRLIGALFAASYAQWCTRRMARDTNDHFSEKRSDRRTSSR